MIEPINKVVNKPLLALESEKGKSKDIKVKKEKPKFESSWIIAKNGYRFKDFPTIIKIKKR